VQHQEEEEEEEEEEQEEQSQPQKQQQFRSGFVNNYKFSLSLIQMILFIFGGGVLCFISVRRGTLLPRYCKQFFRIFLS